MNFEQFVADIHKNHWNLYGVEVYEQGMLTHQYGDTQEGLYDIYSATKSVLSLAVGIAYDQGKFDLQKSILSYLPRKITDKLSNRQKKAWEKITIHRLLTMSVCDLPFRPTGENFLDYSLLCEIPNPEKVEFHYSNISAYLVGVALDYALEEDLCDFIIHSIMEPLEIEKYELGRSPEGHFYGASYMKLTVHGLSQIGRVFMGKGVYFGKRIVSEKYVEIATSVQQENCEDGYGYLIWKYQNGLSISGKWKQKCYCLPEQGIMVTFLAHIEEDCPELLRSMERNIYGKS